MPNQLDLDHVYMQVACLHGKLSKAQRKQVGAVIVTKSGIMIPGYNGTASGRPNLCEDTVDNQLVTKPEVIHAELNCILKAAREGVSVVDSTCYVSLSPCVPCSAMLAQAGIKRLVYLEQYRTTEGIELLLNSDIRVDKLKERTN
jgi:dCMP deaminase